MAARRPARGLAGRGSGHLGLAYWFVAAQQEALELHRRIVEPVTPEAVVHDGARLGDRRKSGCPELGEVVLDRRLRELQLLRDLGEVEIAAGQELEDPEPRLVAERTMQPDEGLRRQQRVDALEGIVGNGIAEEPPVAAPEEEVVRPGEVRRGKDDAPHPRLPQPADAAGGPLDEIRALEDRKS